MSSISIWNQPPTSFILADNDLHVWQATLAQPPETIQRLYSWLSADEQVRAERYRFERDYRRYIIGRGALRSILGNYLDLSPYSITFEYGVKGKPRLAAYHAMPLEFNVSHSHELAVYAVAHQSVGIDVEYIGRRVADAERLALRFFSVNENKVFSALPVQQRRAAFLRCWTRKEAFIKARGDGLSHPLDRFDVTLASDQPPAVLSIDGDVDAAQHWSLFHLEPTADYVGAVAIEGQKWKLAGWRWQAGS